MDALAGQIRLDFRSDEPIYLQIVRQIEALVKQGTLQPGDQLPTVRQLAIDLRINFSTVARAYRILDEQRLISTQRGRGTYIWENAGKQESAAPPSADKMDARLAALARQFLRDAAGQGASAAQIEQVFQQELEGWKRSRKADIAQTNGVET